MSIASTYCNTLKDNFTGFHANWVPGRPLELGDYGQLVDGVFSPIGNVQKEGIMDLDIREDPTKDQYEFNGASETEFNAAIGGSGSGGSVGNVKASLDLTFSNANSVFFNAADCRLRSVANVRALGERLIELDKQSKWKRPWVVVTGLIVAGSTTIVVSESSNVVMKLEATVDTVKEIDLADASLKLQLKTQRNKAFKLLTQDGLMPLMTLMQVRRPFGVGNRTFDPAGFALSPEAGPEDVYFGLPDEAW